MVVTALYAILLDYYLSRGGTVLTGVRLSVCLLRGLHEKLSCDPR